MKHLLSVVLALSVPLAAAGQQPEPATPLVVPPPPVPDAATLGEPLVVGLRGRVVRTVVAPDPVAAAIVSGTWTRPQAGESLPGGGTWKPVSLGADGRIEDAALRNGYVYVPVNSPREQVMILAASGHSLAYVNGEPRTGDPYANGMVRLPVLLRRGQNDVLLRGGGRGGAVRLAVRPAPAPVFIETADATLPDLVDGATGRLLAAVVVVNATDQWQHGWTIRAGLERTDKVVTPVPALAPLSVTKVPFEFAAKPVNSEAKLEVALVRNGAEEPPVRLALRRCGPADCRVVTFRSDIDGSVQVYAWRPSDGPRTEGQALILTLHGAGVEALNQANAYASKPWADIVAPTNRRAFGFDWEDWGRLDALEVLEHAESVLRPDPRRIYLTGHSMGGHGTWQVGAHAAPRFAAIAPSAGWISFWSYGGAAAYDGASALERVLRRASSPSDTLALRENYLQHGVYVLHGDADDNVPVAQAREMRRVLAEFHPDFAYYERPGAGHWWGNECVDWPPLMEFLRGRQRPAVSEVRHVRFTTATPGILARSDWATIEMQIEQLKPSRVDLRLDAAARRFSGTTENVARLSLDLNELSRAAGEGEGEASRPAALEPHRPLHLEFDGQTLADVPWPADNVVRLARDRGQWTLAQAVSPTHKGPRRAGLFKDAFRNRVLLVVGTGGTPEENAYLLARARYDAETFWYRGNGMLPIVLDTAFDPRAEPDRNIVLYGNAATNRAWPALLGDSPVQVTPGLVAVGSRRERGDDLACLLIRPRPGSETASVGAVAGTGLAGLRLTASIPYFRSGVGLPDWIVVGPEALKEGVTGIRGAGFFGNDWSLSDSDSGWIDGMPASGR